MRVVLVAALLLAACASQPKLEQTYSDEQLVYMVQDALMREPKLAQTRILVSAMNATVSLDGWTRTDDQRQLAGDVARRVEGVRSVINNLHL